MVKSHINSIFYDRCEDFFKAIDKKVQNGPASFFMGPFKEPYNLNCQGKDKDFIHDCGQDVFIGLWECHLRYLTNSFSDKNLINRIT